MTTDNDKGHDWPLACRESPGDRELNLAGMKRVLRDHVGHSCPKANAAMGIMAFPEREHS